MAKKRVDQDRILKKMAVLNDIPAPVEEQQLTVASASAVASVVAMISDAVEAVDTRAVGDMGGEYNDAEATAPSVCVIVKQFEM